MSWRDRFAVPRASIAAMREPCGAAAEERLLVALVDLQRDLHGLATRLLRQQGDFHAVGEREALRARLEIRGRSDEELAGAGRRIALVVLHQRGDVDRRGKRRAVGLRVGNELRRRTGWKA